jgi:putative IMPACT (imprinted ancient) family translation regulator
MKPTKNNFFCLDSNKTKMRFETEKKALNFIKFNSHEIEKETGKAPTRCYFCIACNSYHVTSNKIDYKIKSKTEHILEQYNKDINKKTYKEILPNSTFEGSFLDENRDNQYKNEKRFLRNIRDI